MNFVEARDDWTANDGWQFADRDAAWNYFFTAGMVASDELHKPLAQQASDWHALYAKAKDELNRLRARDAQWIEFALAVGNRVGCLASTFPDANEHILRKLTPNLPLEATSGRTAFDTLPDDYELG